MADPMTQAARAMPQMCVTRVHAGHNGWAVSLIEGPVPSPDYRSPAFATQYEATIWMLRYQARACVAAYLRASMEPTQTMKEAALDESGARVSAYEAPRESGVPVECDISEADAEQINADLMESFADTFRAMRLAELESLTGEKG